MRAVDSPGGGVDFLDDQCARSPPHLQPASPQRPRRSAQRLTRAPLASQRLKKRARGENANANGASERGGETKRLDEVRPLHFCFLRPAKARAPSEHPLRGHRGVPAHSFIHMTLSRDIRHTLCTCTYMHMLHTAESQHDATVLLPPPAAFPSRSTHSLALHTSTSNVLSKSTHAKYGDASPPTITVSRRTNLTK